MNSRRLMWAWLPSLREGYSVAAGCLGRNVYRQKGHEEDQDGVKRDFSDVGSRTPPLLYSLPNHGGSPWGRKSHARIGAEAACHRTYGVVLGANLNCSESGFWPPSVLPRERIAHADGGSRCTAGCQSRLCPLWVNSRHASRLGSVRFTPKSGHRELASICPLSAKS